MGRWCSGWYLVTLSLNVLEMLASTLLVKTPWNRMAALILEQECEGMLLQLKGYLRSQE